MEQPQLSRSIVKVVRLDKDAAGTVTPVLLYERSPKRPKKKTTRFLRPLEKLARRTAGAEATFAKTYASRHRRSNTKKKDGWVRDLNVNLLKAARRGFKKSPVGRILPS